MSDILSLWEREWIFYETVGARVEPERAKGSWNNNNGEPPAEVLFERPRRRFVAKGAQGL